MWDRGWGIGLLYAGTGLRGMVESLWEIKIIRNQVKDVRVASWLLTPNPL
jgi:hypothetical protein